MIGRRDFITLLGGAVAWPVAVRAQQSAMPLVGYLHGASAESYAPMIGAFRRGLAQVGYVEGRNVAIDYRWAEGRVDRLASMVTELAGGQPAVLATGGGDEPAFAAKAATGSIPIVFTIGSDPVEHGLIRDLRNPGENITGVTFFTILLGPKRLEILREIVPKAAVIAILVRPSRAESDAKEVQSAARSLGLNMHVLNAGNQTDIDTAFRSLAREGADALLVVSNPLFTSRREQIVALANYHRIPTIYPLREYVASGGLISYGASIKDAYRQTGIYAGRILKGVAPSDLPVLQPTKFELVINLNAAKALGLEVPPSLLALADEVIE
jgi:putative ABC transport system substrate-binding protein